MIDLVSYCDRLQRRAFRDLARFQVAPQCDEELAGEGDDADLAHSRVSFSEPLFVPAAEFAIGLVDQPLPGELHRQGPEASIAALAHPFFSEGLSTLMGDRFQPDQGAYLAAVLELTPGEELHG